MDVCEDVCYPFRQKKSFEKPLLIYLGISYRLKQSLILLFPVIPYRAKYLRWLGLFFEHLTVTSL